MTRPAPVQREMAVADLHPGYEVLVLGAWRTVSRCRWRTTTTHLTFTDGTTWVASSATTVPVRRPAAAA